MHCEGTLSRFLVFNTEDYFGINKHRSKAIIHYVIPSVFILLGRCCSTAYKFILFYFLQFDFFRN